LSDIARGRSFTVISLSVLLVLNAALSLFAQAAPATRYGRPALAAAACLLIWQGRDWGKWLLALLSLGILLAGPISLGSHLSPVSLGGLLMWVVSAATAVSLWALFRNADVRAFLSSRRSQPAKATEPAPN
jgi:hypothetical protein